MKSVKLVECFKKAKKEINTRYDKNLKHVALTSFILSVFIVAFFIQSQHFSIPVLSSDVIISISMLELFFFSAVFAIGSICFGLGVIVGVFVIPKIRETDWKSSIIDKLLVKRKTVYTNISDEKFAQIVGNEIERILKKYGIIPDKPVSTGLSMANEGYQDLKMKLGKVEFDLQSATAEIAELKKKLGF